MSRVHIGRFGRRGPSKFIPWGKNPGTVPQCYASVHDDFGVGFHQCPKKASVFEENGNQWCGTHSPAAQAARDKKSADAYAKRQRIYKLNQKRLNTRETLLKVLREIEAGHNDPRALAREVLAEYDYIFSDAAMEVAEKGDTST